MSEVTRLYVGNIAWRTTDQSLRDVFSEFGECTDAKIICDRYSGRSKGFGFVTFNKSENANEAIQKMNGAQLDGRELRVELSQAKY